MAHLVHQRANAREAGIVVRLAEIHRAADLRVHLRAAQLLGGSLLADGRLHQRRPGQEKPAAFGHQDVVAHHRQISAARHAHAHDGGDLRDAHRAHHGVVAEDAPKIVGVGENVFLQRQKDAGGIHQIDRGNVIFDGDILRADHLLRGHGKESAGLHRGVVGDDHHQPPGDAPQAGDRSRGGRAAPFLVHLVGGVDAQLEELRAGSISLAMRSRAVRRPFLCCASMACGAAALADRSSSFLISVRRSTMRRVFLERRGLGV